MVAKEAMTGGELAASIQAVRKFSRFYTRRIGLLHEGLLGGKLSLTEGRVIYELAQFPETSAAAIAATLSLDAGYLSRLLRGFEERGLIVRRPSQSDGRQALLSLTPRGRKEFHAIDRRSRDEVGAMLGTLSAPQRRQLVAALASAETLLGGDAPPASAASYLLRPPRPGDFGWVIHAQARLYADEYGWDERFEALLAEIVGRFIKHFDAQHERCWIAEREGAIVGSVFLVREARKVAKLRMLFVAAEARGLGIGKRLVAECIGFARDRGYRRITLWTNDILVAARRIYQETGFRLIEEERHHSFGHDLVGQNWELDL